MDNKEYFIVYLEHGELAIERYTCPADADIEEHSKINWHLGNKEYTVTSLNGLKSMVSNLKSKIEHSHNIGVFIRLLDDKHDMPLSELKHRSIHDILDAQEMEAIEDLTGLDADKLHLMATNSTWTLGETLIDKCMGTVNTEMTVKHSYH